MSRSCYVPTTYRPYLLYNRDHPSQGWINVRFFLLFGVLNVLMSCQTRCMTRPKITWKCGTRNQKSTTCALKQDQTHLQSTFLILVFPRQLSNMYKNFELFSNSCTSYGSQLDIIYIYIYIICYMCIYMCKYLYIHPFLMFCLYKCAQNQTYRPRHCGPGHHRNGLQQLIPGLSAVSRWFLEEVLKKLPSHLEDHPRTCKWLITMVILSPLRIGLWDPFQMAIHGL